MLRVDMYSRRATGDACETLTTYVYTYYPKHVIARSLYFQAGQRVPRRKGLRAMERLEECQKHSRTPIQSSRFLSYRFHRPLERSSVKRNAQDSWGKGGQATEQGITAVTRETDATRRDATRRE